MIVKNKRMVLEGSFRGEQHSTALQHFWWCLMHRQYMSLEIVPSIRGVATLRTREDSPLKRDLRHWCRLHAKEIGHSRPLSWDFGKSDPLPAKDHVRCGRWSTSNTIVNEAMVERNYCWLKGDTKSEGRVIKWWNDIGPRSPAIGHNQRNWNTETAAGV